MIHKSKKFGFTLLLIFILCLVLSRFLWLDRSARFTRDESSDLARMHEYWKGKKITLVGPISNDNIKVFSSLTYYMLMPFAALGNFDPVSPVWGTAFFGLLTALLLYSYVKKTNASLIAIACIALIIWYPLVLTSRWAWNPHLVPFWMALAIWSFSQKSTLWSLVAGLSLGLSVHNHYVALVPAAIFLLIIFFHWWRKKKDRYLILIAFGGFAFSFLPFILFDMRHPPGLFLRSYFLSTQPNIETTITFAQFISRLVSNVGVTLETFAPGKLSASLAGLATLALVYVDVRSKKYLYLQWLAPLVGLIIAGIFLDGFHLRYVVGVAPFYFVYIFQRRSSLAWLVQIALLVTILATSAIQFPGLMTRPGIPPSIKIIREASNYINKTIKSNPEIKNANVTTDMSEDMDMLATKYRDYLSIRGVQFRAASEYDASEHLFVISQETEDRLRESESFPLKVFAKQKVNEIFEIPQTDWRVLWFSY